MQKLYTRTTITILLFTIGILTAFLAPYFPETKLLFRLLLVISMIYLIFGWYLFKGYYPEGHPLVLFIMGYFYAGVFIGSVFVLAKWPFSKTMIAVSLFWVVVQTVFIIVLRKKMPLKGFIQFLIEAALMLIISVFQIVIY